MTDIARLLPLLACPQCGGSIHGDADTLVCSSCGEQFSTARGIPRLMMGPLGDAALKTQASFGYEWTHFHDWRPSGAENFADYFVGLDLTSLRTSRVLDAGCGMGRHAVWMAQHASHVVAMDFSSAIEEAATNLQDKPSVDCVQADLTALPFRNAAFDYIYSLGVLHHLAETERALDGLVHRLKPGGRMRIYLYWRHTGWKGALLHVVSALRKVTTRLPFPVLRVLCWLLSCCLWVGLIVPYRLLAGAGIGAVREWPLAVYTKYPFTVLYNDQFDRFSAPIEKRYNAADVRRLLECAGLRDIRIWPRYGWIAEGTLPGQHAAD
jgi:SAM-dependent methyltransferase